MTILVLRLVLFTAGVIPGLLIPFVYHFSTKGVWRQSNVGRSMMTLACAIAALYLNGLISLILPLQVALILRPFILLFLAIALWVQLYTLLHVQVWRFRSRKSQVPKEREQHKRREEG